MKDTYHTTKTAQAIVPAVKSAAADGTAVDTQGFGSLLFVVNSGAIAADGDFGLKVQESADNSTWADADTEVVLGAFPATLEADSTYAVGYVGGKRYARLVLSKAGGTSIALGAIAVLSHPAIAPVA